MTEAYDSVEPSHGFDGEPLDTGWYHLEIEDVLETKVTDKGVPRVRVQLSVLAPSPLGVGKKAFVALNLGPSDYNPDGSKRSVAEVEKAGDGIMKQMSGFLRSIGVHTGAAVGSGPEKAFAFFSVNGWKGRKFVGKIRRREGKGEYGPSNDLSAFYHVDDEKKGVSWLAGQGVREGVVI